MGNVPQRSPVPKESNNQCQDKTRNGFRSKILKLRSRSFRKTHRGDSIPVKSNGNFPSQHHSYLTPDEIRNIQVILLSKVLKDHMRIHYMYKHARVRRKI